MKNKTETSKIIGNRYGKLVVIEYIHSIPIQGRIFKCKCDCGNIIERSFSKLNNKEVKSCGCLAKDLGQLKIIDMTGHKIGEWSVVSLATNEERVGKNKKGAYWKCICSCGNIGILYATDLRSGYTKSCGCRAPSMIAEAHRKNHPSISSAKSAYGAYNDGDISFDTFLELSQQNCYYCGAEPAHMSNVFKNSSIKYSIDNGLFLYNGLDRIDSSIKEHNTNNVVPCCKRCNFAKSNFTVKEFAIWLTRLYDHYCK